MYKECCFPFYRLIPSYFTDHFFQIKDLYKFQEKELWKFLLGRLMLIVNIKTTRHLNLQIMITFIKYNYLLRKAAHVNWKKKKKIKETTDLLRAANTI